jgi:hypothetical protein
LSPDGIELLFLSEISLNEFTQEQFYFVPGSSERFPPHRGGAVDSAAPPAQTNPLGTQQSTRFKPMQHRIKRAGTQFVAMALQFLNHPKTEYGFLARVVEDMDANQT